MPLHRGRLLLLLTLALVLPWSASGQQPQLPGGQGPPGEVSTRSDHLGDPLPPGASARLGSVRFQFNHLIAVTFSPDGKTLLAVGGVGATTDLRFWETTTGKEVARFERKVPVHGMRFAFSPDGKALALGHQDTIELLDWRTGKYLRTLRGKHQLQSLAYSPDGTLLAVTFLEAKTQGVIRIWETATGRELPALEDCGASLHALRFTADGKHLVSAAWAVHEMVNNTPVLVPGAACVWDVAGRKKLHHLAHASSNLALSPDGILVAVQGQDGKVQVNEIATGNERCQIPTRGSTLAFTPDSKGLLLVDHEEGPALWDAATGKQLRSFEGRAGGTLRLGDISPDGKLVAVTGGDWNEQGNVYFWNMATGKEVRRTAGHQDKVTSVAFAPNGKLLASGSLDWTVRLWDPASGKEVRQLTGHKGVVYAVAFAPDGKTLASSGSDDTTRLWDVAGGKEIAQLAGPHTGATALAFSRDGQTLFAGGSSGRVHVWQLPGGKPGRHFEVGLDTHVLAFSPDGKAALAGRRQRLPFDEAGPEGLYLWDTAAGKTPLEMPLRKNLEQNGVVECHAAAASADGRLIASSQSRYSESLRGTIGTDQRVRLWERATGQEILKIDNVMGQALAFSADSRVFAVAHGELYHGWRRQPDPRVTLWNTLTGEMLRQFSGHQVPASCVAFSPDGQTLATGGSDHTILLWECPRPAEKRPLFVADAQHLEGWWNDLAGNAATAHKAIVELFGCPAQAVPMLRQHLKPAPAVDNKRIALLLKELDSPRFVVRQQASAELEKFGELAELALRKALVTAPSLEYRRRLEVLLTKASNIVIDPARLRWSRALTALDWIGDAEARKLLTAVAAGAPEARRTWDARASLERLDQRVAK